MANTTFVHAETASVNADNPWPGLLPFSEADQAFFQGRRNETEELTRLVLRERVSVLFGLSGLGKSSLLQAGLFPALRQENVFPVYIRLDHSSGGSPLADQVREAIGREALASEIDAPAARPGDTLWEYYHRQEADFWNRRNRPVVPLLVFDQFEEVFTLGQADASRQRATELFLDELGSLAEGHPPSSVEARLNGHPEQAEEFQFGRHHYKILFAVREDFLPELEGLRSRITAVGVNRMRLLRMNGEAALQAVNQAPRLIDPDVAERVVRFVAAGKVSGGPLSSLDVEPALLSVVCRELNNKRKQQGSARITAGLLEGSQTEVLTDFYERGLTDLPLEVREFVEENLITVSGYRDSVALENALSKPGVTREHLGRLIDRRLIRIDDSAGERIELTHDLLTGVVRASRDRRRQKQAKEREAEARREAEERERQRRAVQELRRSRVIAAAFLLLALVAIAAAWLAYQAGKEAQRQQSLAEQRADEARRFAARASQSAREAEVARIAAKKSEQEALNQGASAMREKENAVAQQSRAEEAARREQEARALADRNSQLAEERATDAQTQRSAALAQRAEADRQRQLALDAQREEQTQRRAVAKSLAQADVLEAGRLTDLNRKEEALAYLARALRSDPSSLAAVSLTSDLLLRARIPTGPVPGRPGASILRLPEQTERVLAAVFSPNGQFVVSGVWDKAARVWDAATGTLVRELTGHGGLVNAVDVSPDNRWIATGSHDGLARIWNASTGALTLELKGHTQPVNSVNFSGDGRLLVTGSSDKTARVWDLPSGSPGRVLSHQAPVSSAAFGPSRRVVTASWDNRAQIWNLNSAEPELKLPHNAQVNSAVFSPDGRRVVTASQDGTAQVWEGTRPVGAVLRHRGPVNSAAFSPDGRRVVTSSDDNSARVWEAATGAPISLPLIHEKRVSSASFAADGLRVVTGGYDRAVRLWEVRSEWDDAALLAEAAEVTSGYQAARLPDLVPLSGGPKRLEVLREHIRPLANPTAVFIRWSLRF